MTGGRWFVLALISLVFLIGTFFLHGLVQMGDCYPEEPIHSRCLADQARIGRNVLIVAGLAYILVAWLVMRGRKLS